MAPSTPRGWVVVYLAIWRGPCARGQGAYWGAMRAGGLVEFELASQAGNERVAAERVRAYLLEGEALDARRLDGLTTAVSEAVLNAMEHGNGFEPSRQVRVLVSRTSDAVTVSVSDDGNGPPPAVATPDLDDKLAGRQSPRGWGRFLMQQLVDDVSDEVEDDGHTVHLVLKLR